MMTMYDDDDNDSTCVRADRAVVGGVVASSDSRHSFCASESGVHRLHDRHRGLPAWKFRQGVELYRVKWAGFSSKENTLEPSSHFEPGVLEVLLADLKGKAPATGGREVDVSPRTA